MNQFAHVLRRAEARLEAPEPHRSRILLEIAHDLDELYGAYRERGLSEADAAARAEATFALSPDVLEELGQMHAPPYARLLARFSARGRHRIERTVLTVLTLFAAGAGTAAVAATSSSRSSSPLLWALLALLGGFAWIVSRAVLDLYLRPYRPRASGQLTPMLALVALSLTVGALGTLVEAWQLAALLETGRRGATPALLHVGRASQLLTLSLCLSLTILLAWFHLRRRSVELEQARMLAVHLTQHPSQGELP